MHGRLANASLAAQQPRAGGFVSEGEIEGPPAAGTSMEPA